jgi:hypothetical protein
MRVVAGSDWVIDIGPGAGEDGGHVVAEGQPAEIARARRSRTAPYLARFIDDSIRAARRTMSRDRRMGAPSSTQTEMSSVA